MFKKIHDKYYLMNYCPECGSGVDQETRFCPNCGHELYLDFSNTPISTPTPPIQYSTPPRYPQYYKSDNTKGIIALIFGIVGFIVLPFIGSIIAIIFGSLSRSQEEDRTMGTLGIVLGILGLLCWIIFFVVLFSWIFSLSYPYYL